jgi:predicted adenine nucleotide alpha hydrolase (AANH) superfamily ATPase
MMAHLRQHLVKDAVSDGNDWKEHCNYCLDTLATASQKKTHEENHHLFLSTFKVSTRLLLGTILNIHKRFP